MSVRTIALFLLAGGLLQAATPADVTYWDHSTYRIAASHDGNQHDRDDIGAVPWELALLYEAGLTYKLVHLHHSNHLYDSGGQYREMRDGVNAAASRFGVDSSIVFDCVQDVDAAVNHLAAEIDKSTADDRLYICAAGPMETVYESIVRSDPAKRQYVTVISHSVWNNNHGDFNAISGGDAHTWGDLKDLGVVLDQIENQNVYSDGSGGWNVASLSAYFGWLNDSPQTNADWQWLYDQMDRAKDGDVSDAGMMWYVITGRGIDVGDGPLDAQVLFEASLEGDDSQAPSVPANLDANALAENYVELSWDASTDNIGVREYRIYRDGSQVGSTDQTMFEDWGLSPQTSYTYEVSAVDYRGNESSRSATASATTLDVDTTDPQWPANALVVDEVLATQATLSWQAATDDRAVYRYEVRYGDGSVAAEVQTTSATIILLPSTNYTFTVVAFDAAGNNATSNAVALTTPAAPAFSMAINAGGNAYTASDGTDFIADAYYDGGGTITVTDAIAGTDDDPIFQSSRNGDFAYAIPLDTTAYYDVELLFTDSWEESPGARTFDIMVEGSLMFDDFDIAARAGGRNIAYRESFRILIDDGALDLTFIQTDKNPHLMGVHIVYAGSDGGGDPDEDPPSPPSGLSAVAAP